MEQFAATGLFRWSPSSRLPTLPVIRSPSIMSPLEEDPALLFHGHPPTNESLYTEPCRWVPSNMVKSYGGYPAANVEHSKWVPQYYPPWNLSSEYVHIKPSPEQFQLHAETQQDYNAYQATMVPPQFGTQLSQSFATEQQYTPFPPLYSATQSQQVRQPAQQPLCLSTKQQDMTCVPLQQHPIKPTNVPHSISQQELSTSQLQQSIHSVHQTPTTESEWGKGISKQHIPTSLPQEKQGTSQWPSCTTLQLGQGNSSRLQHELSTQPPVISLQPIQGRVQQVLASQLQQKQATFQRVPSSEAEQRYGTSRQHLASKVHLRQTHQTAVSQSHKRYGTSQHTTSSQPQKRHIIIGTLHQPSTLQSQERQGTIHQSPTSKHSQGISQHQFPTSSQQHCVTDPELSMPQQPPYHFDSLHAMTTNLEKASTAQQVDTELQNTCGELQGKVSVLCITQQSQSWVSADTGLQPTIKQESHKFPLSQLSSSVDRQQPELAKSEDILSEVAEAEQQDSVTPQLPTVSQISPVESEPKLQTALHQDPHHQQNQSDSSSQKLSVRLYRCVECGEIFKTKSCLKIHVYFRHKLQRCKDLLPTKLTVKLCRCKDCGKIFRNKVCLRTHVYSQHK